MEKVSSTIKNGLGTSLPNGIVLLLRTCISFIVTKLFVRQARAAFLFLGLLQTVVENVMKRERKQD